MSGIHTFTIAAANYIPKVRVLFHSLRRWQPDWKLHFAVADAPPAASALASVEAACYSQVLQAGTPEDTAREWRNWQTRRT